MPINDTASVSRHYEAGVDDCDALVATVTALVDKIEPPLTAQKLAAFDQFHFGGLAMTAELARRAKLKTGDVVLDAGSGLGGPSRFLAETVGCRVIGIDLTPAYVAVAQLLAARAGLAGTVTYDVGSITAMSFADAHFDAIWTQHVVMNISDRAGLYREFRRVLKPGGRLAFFDPIAASGAEAPYFPVPWAETPALSTLLTADATRAALEQAGFEVTALDDVTETALGAMAQRQAPTTAAPPPLSLGTVMGPRMREMVSNFARNLTEGRIRLVMGICEAA
jgi:ubiquinone/menaquinone biosynthesis C-methylase UbiE